MAADDQALAGNAAAIVTMIGAAFALANTSWLGPPWTSRLPEISLSNPRSFFFLGGFLMIPNLTIPSFSTIQYASASIATKYAFYGLAGTGAIGMFIFMMGFGSAVMNLVKLKTSRGLRFDASENFGPYRWLVQKRIFG